MVVLVTGATGNVGQAVIEHCQSHPSNLRFIAAVRDVEKAKSTPGHSQGLQYRHFDFTDKSTYTSATREVDILFLLRPPEITDVDRYFKPLLIAARENGVRKIVFISVQGVERSKFIPHHKIEQLIQQLELDYIFIRPSYFMQNLTGYLLDDIIQKGQIELPSGKAVFNWIDVQDIAVASSVVLDHFDKYAGKVFAITGRENLNFHEVAQILTNVLKRPILYKSVNPFTFFVHKKKEGLSSSYIMVLILLHFLPRWQPAPEISSDYSQLTGKEPHSLKNFVSRKQAVFSK